MKAVYLMETGAPDVLRYGDLPEPALGPNDVLIRVRACSLNRLDVFTRLIADRSEVFDSVPGGYEGRLYAEISPRSFSVKLRKGSRLNQIRFRRRNSQQDELTQFRLSDRDLRELHEHLGSILAPA